MTEIKCKTWYIDITLDGETDTHTVHLLRPGTELTALAYLFTHRLREYTSNEIDRMVIEAFPANPNLFFERSEENDTHTTT